MSVLVGWRCSSGRAQRCRRETSINQSAMPCLSAFPLVTAFGLRVADRQVGKQMPRAPSAAFAFCLYRRRYGKNSQHEPSRVPVRLSPATSLLRCLRGAAKQQFNLSRSLSLCTRRLGSKWRTSATEEPRTRCENCYPDACSLFRFLPRLVHQRALEICLILDCNYSSNRQQPRR